MEPTWSLHRLTSSRPFAAALWAAERWGTPARHVWERMGCLDPLVRLDGVPAAASVGGVVFAGLSDTRLATEFLPVPPGLLCLNHLALLES